jgi:hypothetical protein
MLGDDAPGSLVDETSAPEAHTPDVAEPAPAATSEDNDPAGTPRDERGRFASRSEAPGESGTAEPTDSDDDALPGEGDPPQDPAAVASTDPPPAPEPEPVPYAFRVNGQEQTIEGATYRKGVGLVIPEGAAMERATRLHTLGRYWEAQGQQQLRSMEQRLAATESFVSEDVARGQAVAAFFDDLLAQGPEAVAMWLDGFQQNAPILAERARADALHQQLQAMKRGQQPPERERAADPTASLREEAGATLAETIGEVRTALPDLAGLTDADVAEITAAVREHDPLTFFRYPTEDEVITHGLDPRAPVLDAAKLERLVRLAARALIGPREAAAKARAEAEAAAKKKQEAAQANARRLAGTQPGKAGAPPSTAPAVGSTAPAGRRFASKADYDAYKRRVYSGS